jgi:undecaprenyl diphosphate synthase
MTATMTTVNDYCSSGSWLGRSMSYLNSSYYQAVEETSMEQENHLCLLLGVFKVSPFAEEVLSLLLPLLVGVFLGSIWHNGASKHRSLHATSKRFAYLLSVVKFLILDNNSQKQVKRDVIMKPNYPETVCESGVDPTKLPKPLAVIMDGNRRYGRKHYGKGSLGHLDGAKKTIEFLEWCSTEGVEVVTLYCFSTENWNRSKAEVDVLMALFERFLRDDILPILHNRGIRFNHLYSNRDKIPKRLSEVIEQVTHDTKDFGRMKLNLCMSYGSRPEIVNATQKIAQECCAGNLKPSDITEEVFSNNLTTADMPDPEIMMRTSGEYRISNYLLWQCAYSELFFLNCDWPELEKEDLLDILRQFANGRHRRFGT